MLNVDKIQNTYMLSIMSIGFGEYHISWVDQCSPQALIVERFSALLSFSATLSVSALCYHAISAVLSWSIRKCIVMVINQLRQEACVPRGPRVYMIQARVQVIITVG